MRKKYRIKSRTRFILALCILVVMLVSATSNVLGLDFGKDTQKYATVEIVAGDTLWNIAAIYSDHDQDLRKLVNKICKLNDLDAGEIYPGQTILVPLEG